MIQNFEDKKKLFEYSILGTMFPVSIMVGLAIGFLLDRWFHSQPLLTIIFTCFGVAAGFVNLIQVLRKHARK